MADEEQKHQAYFGFKTREDGNYWAQFSYGTSLDDLKKWGKSDKYEKDQVEEVVLENTDQLISFNSIINKILESGLALSELSSAYGVVKGLFATIVSRTEVIDPIKESCPVVFDDGSLQIYGISADRLTKIREQHRRLVRMDRGFDMLPSAVLLTVVATFDSLMADMVRQLLTLKPERFNASDKALTAAEILSMNSFEDVKNKLIDDEVYLFSRGSHDEQVKYIQKWFNVDASKNWKRWPDFIEIFERRNLIAHGEKLFTSRYVNICKNHGHKGSEKLLGNEIELTRNYISQSIDVLIEFSLLVSFSIWRKQVPEEEGESFDAINLVCYKLIAEDRYKIPIRVIEYVLSLQGAKISEATRLMLIVNLASAYKHSNDNDQAIKTLEKVDWSAVSDKYRICVASIKEDVDAFVKLMPNVVSAKYLNKTEFREWPVFSFVRSDEKVQQKFEEIFGEILFDPTLEATDLNDGDPPFIEGNSGEENDDDSQTLH